MTLFILRHGKTEKTAPDGTDHGRRLLHEGIASIAELCKRMSSLGDLPQRIMTSDATRALHTATLVREGLVPTAALETRTALYNANPDMVITMLAGSKEQSIMVVGHNPCLEDLVAQLTGRQIHLRPGACAVIRYDSSQWEGLFDPPRPREVEFLDPRE